MRQQDITDAQGIVFLSLPEYDTEAIASIKCSSVDYIAIQLMLLKTETDKPDRQNEVSRDGNLQLLYQKVIRFPIHVRYHYPIYNTETNKGTRANIRFDLPTVFQITQIAVSSSSSSNQQPSIHKLIHCVRQHSDTTAAQAPQLQPPLHLKQLAADLGFLYVSDVCDNDNSKGSTTPIKTFPQHKCRDNIASSADLSCSYTQPQPQQHHSHSTSYSVSSPSPSAGAMTNTTYTSQCHNRSIVYSVPIGNLYFKSLVYTTNATSLLVAFVLIMYLLLFYKKPTDTVTATSAAKKLTFTKNKYKVSQ